MATKKKDVHVTPRGNKWAVMREGNERATSLHNTQAEAVKKGRLHAEIRRSSSCTTSKAKLGNGTATARTLGLLKARGK
jgi:hypothetical protein